MTRALALALIVAGLAALTLARGWFAEYRARITADAGAAARFARDSASLERLEDERDIAREAVRAAEAHAIAERAGALAAIADYDSARAKLAAMTRTLAAVGSSSEMRAPVSVAVLPASFVTVADSLRARCQRSGDACTRERSVREIERDIENGTRLALEQQVSDLHIRLDARVSLPSLGAGRSLWARLRDGVAGAGVGYLACRLERSYAP